MTTFNCQHCGAALLKDKAPALTCGGCKSAILIPESEPLQWQGHTIRCDNKRVRRGRYPFPVDGAEHPLLRQYPSEFPFDIIFDGAEDEFAALVNLRHRVRNDWYAQRPAPEFLKRYGFWRANRDNPYWHCTHYGRMFTMTAAALGQPARVINVARRVDAIDHDLHGHVVVDIWSNQYQKWVYMDVLFDFHYEDATGTPLSLLEARDRYWRHDCEDLVVSTERAIKGITPGKYPLFGEPGPIGEEFKTRSLNTFWPLFYHGQNYFEIPQEDRSLHLLCYTDDLNRHLGIMGRGKLHFANEEMCSRTDRVTDIYPTMNNAEIGLYVVPGDTPALLAYIDTQTPNLSHVSYRLDDGPWIPLREDAIALPDIAEPLTIQARADNRFGRHGAISSVTLFPTHSQESTP